MFDVFEKSMTNDLTKYDHVRDKARSAIEGRSGLLVYKKKVVDAVGFFMECNTTVACAPQRCCSSASCFCRKPRSDGRGNFDCSVAVVARRARGQDAP